MWKIDSAASIPENFAKFLIANPKLLRDFFRVMSEWYALQGKMPDLIATPGPQEWVAGEKPDLTTVGLSGGDIDELVQGIAEGHIKEKAVSYIKGLLAGVQVVT